VVDYGWAHPVKAPTGWGIGPDEIPLGYNLFLDQARQYTCYALTFRSPIANYTIQQYSVGTGLTPPSVADVALGNPVLLGNSTYFNPIDGVDYPAPFMAQIRFTLGVGDANGYLLTEFGLFSGDQTLLMHWLQPGGLSKTSAWAPSLCHRVNF